MELRYGPQNTDGASMHLFSVSISVAVSELNGKQTLK